MPATATPFKLRELLDLYPGSASSALCQGSGSLVSLAQGACDLSGVHLPRGELRAQSVQACREWADPREDLVIHFVTREMGLMLKRGNPLKITSLKDIVDRKARFVSRDHDSGTRLLFDESLPAPDRRGQDQRRAADGSPTPRWPLTWRAAWPTSASASRPPPGSSGSISSGF